MPEPARKRRILSQKRADLKRCLDAGEPSVEKLHSAADRFREAKILFLKGQRAIAEEELLGPVSSEREEQLRQHLTKVQSTTEQWTLMSLDQVVEHVDD